MGDVESSAITVKVVGDIRRLPAQQWNACAGTANPFVQHEFLAALEESGSAAGDTGWAPYHLVAEDAQGISACAPMYVKSHSQGEFVFDHGWAQAFERAGGQYYPKLLIAVPFTPATGPRLLVRPDLARDAMEDVLISGAIEVAQKHNLSSVNVNFPTEPEWQRLGAAGFLQRTGEQFHWQNDGYESFEGFLNALSSRKRKAIKRERSGAIENGIEIECLSGSDLREEHWDAFFDFYMDTGERKWGRPYLTRPFYSLVGETMGDRVLLVMAKRDGRYIAGALNFVGEDTLYGRYWGCLEDHPFLHFEVCYYQAIEYAIQHRLGRVEAGAQGQHKLSRGYLPIHTYSAHWIANPSFRRAVDNYLDQERAAVDEEIAALDAYSPFKKI
ncbi:MAG: GNAT family N-acetyltransferase [Proteobacteria bacterium]|nr:GNAT family N-acetyltransferase [Pseudomonadota bacterium]MDA1059024.1 GNAT family N-acetyltransferase [Pseudomonadota bacterium]